jgi:hypothetical protein
MLTKDRVREVVKVRLAVLAPVLLSIFTGRSSLDNVLTLTVDTRHHLTEPGETETVEASFTRRKEADLTPRPSLPDSDSASKIDVTVHRDERSE